jgi:type II secretory pathway pseudopilin PulG
MKKSIRSIVGVTLLEIMLVLAIAAMVIVLSIRYYASATASSQANALTGTFQAIIAAASNMSLGSGTYSSVTNTAVKEVLPATQSQSPWGGTITISGATTSFSVTAEGPSPAGICALVLPKLQADIHTSKDATCTDKGTIKFTYTPNPA